jgi:hypothetical protein
MQCALEYPHMLHKLVVVDITPTISPDTRFIEIKEILLAMKDLDVTQIHDRVDADRILSVFIEVRG